MTVVMTKRKKFNRNGSAIAIVAHPDDETIWCGGFIVKHPQFNWTIFSLCRAGDKDRAPKFHRVCKYYNAKAIITDLEDDGQLTVKQTLPIIKKLILKKIGGKKFDFILTHGANGEYGHPRHLGVQQAVKRLIDNGRLKAKMIFYFNYAKSERKKFSPPIAKRNTEFLFHLSAKEFSQKKKVMTELYGFAPNGIDTSYCANPEAFKIISNKNSKS